MCLITIIEIFQDLFPHADAGFGLITQFLIEGFHVGIGVEDLEIDLEATKLSQGLFGMLDELRTNALIAKRGSDSERIEPASVPIITSHNGTNDLFIL